MAQPKQDAETADEILFSWLQYYGLTDVDLVDTIVGAWKTQKIADPSNLESIGFAIKDTEAYKKRFAGNIALQRQGKPTYSLTQYLRLEQDYKTAMQGSGLPAGFYDGPEDFAQFIGNDVSVAEVLRRVRDGFQAVDQANQDVIDEMKRLYGVSKGDLAAYFLDPNTTEQILLNRARAAQIGSEATRQAGISLTAGTAEMLARENVDQARAQQGFASISEAQQLFAQTSSTEEAISQEEQIGAVFGTNAAAAQRVRQRAAQRAAEGQAGGGFAAQGAEVTGLSNA